MDAEQAWDARCRQLGTIGRPRENPENLAPMNPELMKGMAAINAHIEALRLEREAEMSSPEGRKKAAKKAKAELAEKRRAWGTRVGAPPLDGFEGIYDSAKDRELKVYTRTYDLKHKFWGVKPVGMTIWDFWDIYDPEVKRYHDANQETPTNPNATMAAPPLTDSTQGNKAAAKPRRRQKSADVNSTHRVTESTTPSSKINKNPRKPLVDKIESGRSGLENQMRKVDEAARTSGRPTRSKPTATVSGPEQKSARTKSADTTSSPLKRPRGRPPTKDKSSKRPSKQKKTPAVKGNARIAKACQKESRPPAPSTHKMRTRRAGPAEPLQLL